ncbi:hypothetical protein B0H65DRAFT_508402 [Neurospora tetraspora]|uniref:Uncharacterized protein n=1 Tax=Neurospora tetraspora TaxID=94610 RepID=A0AAE0MTU7_9PEZI|nr:hypothetical protein B0H65DRAFT_508402 [Neurospora tetraspora]
MLFDLRDTQQWREVNVKSVYKDLKGKVSSYGGVVLVADQKSTRATRSKTSEPVSGILYHRLEPASLSSDTQAYWMKEITVIATTKTTTWESSQRSYSGTDENEFIECMYQERWDQVDTQGFFWGQLCFFNPLDAHCYIDDYRGITNRSSPSTPVFRIQDNIFVRRIDPRCRLLAEPVFWWLTTFCNLVIAACLSSMAWFYRSAPLVTIGDPIDSFITEPTSPDSKTIPISSCTYHHTSFTNIFRPALPPRAYNPKATPLWKSVSLTRWSLTMAWFLYIVSQCILLFSKALSAENTSAQRLKSFFTFNLNSLDSDHLLYHSDGSDMDILPRRWCFVLLANTPQIFLSLTYLFFNNILTKMTLRTSQPRGSQRSTFFLSLPYRYALPFVVVSGVMHWLISQCLYFTEVDFIDLDGTTLDKSNPTTTTLGYSTWAMFWVIVLGTLSWVAILGSAVFGKYPAGMPIMGSCSAVIAAACHAPLRGRGRRGRAGGDGDGMEDGGEEEGDTSTDIAAGPLSWGVIKQVVVRDGVEVEEKWLGFTRGEAEEPVFGEVYG